MSSQTPNINLTLPVGSEKVSRQIINDNNTKIDTAFGGTAGRELLGYKENGDTASQAIADGSFVVWKGSLYKANGSISQGTAFSNSNLTAVTDGGFNDLKSSVDSLSDSCGNIISEPGTYLIDGIFAGYNTGSGNYIDFYVPVYIAKSRSVTSAKLVTSASVFFGSTRMNLSVPTNLTLVKQTFSGLFLEMPYSSTQTANIQATMSAIVQIVVA